MGRISAERGRHDGIHKFNRLAHGGGSMRHQSQIFLVVLFVAVVTADASSQQLAQPLSVRPWASHVQMQKLPRLQAPASSQQTQPSWLLESTVSNAAASNDRSDLPMVEAESYAELGELRADSVEQRGATSQRKWRPQGTPRRSFSLLRALGFEASRPATRK